MDQSINLGRDIEESGQVKLNKLDILVLNNGWNSKNEKLIVDIGYNAGIYKQLHEQTAKRYNYYHKILSLSLLIFSIFLSADSILNLLNSYILTIIQKIIIFILAIISILNNFLKYGEIAKDHAQSAGLFNVVYNDIRNTMCIYRKDRYNAVKYIQTIIKQYDHLEVNAPEVPSSLIKKMEIKIKNDTKLKNINMPNQFQEIEIMIDGNTGSQGDEAKFKINNMQNIHQIHDCFKIDGDLSENDNITINDINVYKKNGLNLHTQYEMNRFMNTNEEV